MSTLVRDLLPAGWDSMQPYPLATAARRIRVKFEQLSGLLHRYNTVATQRRALSRLTDGELKDIGISRVDAMREASKPFWR